MSQASDNFKSHDAASYDEVAGAFDYWTRRVTGPLAERVVELSGMQPGDRVLDVGTGSGIVMMAAAKRVAPGGKVTAIDLSEGMLRAAQENVTAQDLASAVELRVMDAEHLEFPDRSFDVAVSLFAVLHFPDPRRAIGEIFRVLQPGGRAVIGIGAGPGLSLKGAAAAFTRIFELVNVARGRVLLAPAFLDALVRKHVPQEAEHEKPRDGPGVNVRLKLLLQNAGFQNVRAEWQSCTHRIDSAQEFWDLQATFSSISRKRLRSASAGTAQQVRSEFFSRCDRVLAAGGTLVYRNAALIISGTRPAERA